MPPRIDIDPERFRTMYLSEMTLPELADALDISETTARRFRHALGLAPKPRRRIKPEERRATFAAYFEAGLSVEEIAQREKLSPKTVYQLASDFGLLAKRGRLAMQDTRAIPPAREAEFVVMWQDSNVRVTEMMERFGCSATALRAAARRLDIGRKAMPRTAAEKTTPVERVARPPKGHPMSKWEHERAAEHVVRTHCRDCDWTYGPATMAETWGVFAKHRAEAHGRDVSFDTSTVAA